MLLFGVLPHPWQSSDSEQAESKQPFQPPQTSSIVMSLGGGTGEWPSHGGRSFRVAQKALGRRALKAME